MARVSKRKEKEAEKEVAAAAFEEAAAVTKLGVGPVFLEHCDEAFLDLYYNYSRTYKEVGALAPCVGGQTCEGPRQLLTLLTAALSPPPPQHRGKLERLQKKFWFHVFVSAVEMHPHSKNLLLRDFLIEPVQRVPRYKMLLGELLKYTPERGPASKLCAPGPFPHLPPPPGPSPEQASAHSALRAAHLKLSEVALGVNAKMTEHEQSNKARRLSEAFSVDFAKSGRRLLRDGLLAKTDKHGKPTVRAAAHTWLSSLSVPPCRLFPTYIDVLLRALFRPPRLRHRHLHGAPGLVRRQQAARHLVQAHV